MPADTYTSDGVGVQLMGTGNDNNTWGANANTNVFQIFADAIANALVSTVTGGTLDLSGTPPPAAPSQARYAGLIFTGTLGSNQIVQVPNFSKWWMVANATVGAFTLKFKTPAGSASLAVPQNSGWQMIYCDGANGFIVFPFNTKQIAMPDGSAAAPPYSYVNEPNSFWYRFGTQDHRLSINGVDVLQVTGAGASSPSIVNILAPNVLQVGGAQVLPAGMEIDYAGIELPSSGWLWEDGFAYSRATFAALFGAITKTATGTTHTTTTIDSLSVDLRFKGLLGAFIEGTGITTGTTITAVTATSLTLSAAATGSASGVALRILPWGQGDGSTTFNVPDRRERTLFGRGDMNGTASPGRVTTVDLTKLNVTFGGTGNITLSQANLPNVAFTCTLTVDYSGFNAKIPTLNNNPIYGSGGLGAITGYTGTITQPVTLAGTITAAGTAASGGSGTAFSVLPSGAVVNKIIKT